MAPDCDSCGAEFDANGGCATLRTGGNPSSAIPAACIDLPNRQECEQKVIARCFESKAAVRWVKHTGHCRRADGSANGADVLQDEQWKSDSSGWFGGLEGCQQACAHLDDCDAVEVYHPKNGLCSLIRGDQGPNMASGQADWDCYLPHTREWTKVEGQCAKGGGAVDVLQSETWKSDGSSWHGNLAGCQRECEKRSDCDAVEVYHPKNDLCSLILNSQGTDGAKGGSQWDCYLPNLPVFTQHTGHCTAGGADVLQSETWKEDGSSWHGDLAGCKAACSKRADCDAVEVYHPKNDLCSLILNSQGTDGAKGG